MDLDELCTHCTDKPGCSDGYPFGPGALVMKVAGKIFAIVADESDPPTVSLKCDPEEAPLLRSSYEAVAPGYHLNKRHWNTITVDGTVPDHVVRGWIDDSYDLVLAGLPKRVQESLRTD